MRDDWRRVRPWGSVVAMAIAVATPTGRPAEAQTLHGQADLQYRSVEQVGVFPVRETWDKSIAMDYLNRLGGSVEFSSRFRFVEQTVAGQPDRLRVPEGSARLAHRYFGLSSAFRPSETRDSRGLTTRQQNLSLTGYAQKPGLPSLSGSWIRNHLDPNSQSSGSATVARSVSGNYVLPGVAFRAGYRDRLLEAKDGRDSRIAETHFSLGSSAQFRVGRGPVSLTYDFGQSRANPSGLLSRLSRSHTAGGTSSLQLAPRTFSSLAYTYLRTEGVGAGGTITEVHNGALTVSHSLPPAVDVSAGAGVRSAAIGGRSRTERFLTASASAQGQARPGWRMTAAANRSLNWLPGTRAWTADNFQSGTLMRLARGLDARADLSISAARRPVAPSDSAGPPRDVTVQTGAGVTAVPLRTVFLDASVHRSRAGASLSGGGATSSSYATNLRLTPSARLQLGGNWGHTRGSSSRSTTWQASFQFSPASSMQASGSYNRSRQELSGPTPLPATLQEGYSGSLAMALGRDLNGSFGYTESNPGQATHVRQVSVSLTQRFGR
jgi:hypothetical protein